MAGFAAVRANRCVQDPRRQIYRGKIRSPARPLAACGAVARAVVSLWVLGCSKRPRKVSPFAYTGETRQRRRESQREKFMTQGAYPGSLRSSFILAHRTYAQADA